MHRFVLAQLLAAVGLAAVSVAADAAQPSTRASPDAIFRSGKVVTVNSNAEIAQAFAVRGDRFVAVGSDTSVLALAGPSTRVIDLAGVTVIPGLTDSHDHLWNSAKFQFRGVDVIGVTTLAEMQRRLRAAVAKSRPGELVFTTLGWSVSPALTRADLDAISTTVPIAAISSRQGRGIYNSAALKLLGISKTNPSFKGVNVPVDAAGEPTGQAPGYPTCLEMINSLLPVLSAAQEDDIVAKAMAFRHALGITSIRELSIWPAGANALQRMGREGKLKLRIALGLEFPEQMATAQQLSALPKPARADPWVFGDVTGEEPWPPGAASLEAFTAHIRGVRQAGWRASPHVSSDVNRGVSYDRATEQTIAAYEALDRERPLRAERWVMEHLHFATPAQMQRLAKLGVIVSVQDEGYEPTARAPLPPERMAHQTPVRGLLDHGITVISGSDFTSPNAVEAEPNNPMIPFYFYVTRKNKRGEVHTPTEQISRMEALRTLTTHPAYATFQENVKGQIAPGMYADFVILNQDLLSVPEDRILATRAVATFVGGQRVYAAISID